MGSRGNRITGTILHIQISPGGIPKRAVPEARLTPAGIEGDSWAHPQFHGGPNQAVLLITSEGLEELRELGFDVYPGALGENFTTAGLDRRQIGIGDRYRVGAQAIVEITKMRVPCSTLDVYNAAGGPRIQDAMFDNQVKAGDPSSPRWGLSGFYARVVSSGPVWPGDRISLLDALA